MTLDVLSPEESVALLATVIGADRVAADPQAALRVAELSGYLPLALRWSPSTRPGGRSCPWPGWSASWRTNASASTLWRPPRMN
ncbi:hypothetical protein LUW74_24380 [Actinomadura madurae]|uniref:hypothetical protein n=1 Tax=Actinomadura madurae TaxID=1993 RepID=UPI0020262C5C|nr:hypothetical protein [Actinomadura madurae]URN06142.1 hypothetical protein LUW74_24380 [Actinomadura madurae]